MIARTGVLAAATLTLACGQALPPAPEETRLELLQGALDRWATVGGHHGVSASVVFADGSQWIGVAGLVGPGEPMRPEHLVWIASVTKTMTGALVLQLADEGRLELDDPVSRWIPPLPNVDPGITLRQLLDHSNGLDNYTENPALAAAVAARPARPFSVDELLGFVGPARFQPGTRTQYTNTAFLLLAEVVQAATDRSLVELYRERLWGPLGLTEVLLPGFEPPPAPIAGAWDANGLVAPLDRPALLSTGHGAFGVFASARAAARWGHALFRGRVLSARMQEEMRHTVPAAGNIAGETGVGLGIRSYGYLGRVQYGHSGGSSLGSSLLLHDPSSGVTVAVVMNQGAGADHFVLAPRLLDLSTRP